MNKRIIAIVGMPGSGKSTVIKMLVERFHLPYVHFGSITMEEIRKRGLPETQQSEKKIREELRKTYGMGAYAKLSLPKIKNILSNHDIILIDGLYSWSEYIILRESKLGEIILISIISQRLNRYKRLSTREHRPLTFKEAEERDFAEIEKLEKGGPIALCDYYITNDGTLEELREKVYNLGEYLEIKTHNFIKMKV